MTELLQQLLKDPVGLLFVVISTGLLIGQIPFGSFKLGGSGVLIAGLVFGHYGFLLPKEIQTIGVVLFVYSVGLRAGPSILGSLKSQRLNFIIISLLIVVTAGGMSRLLKKLFGFPVELIAGIYSGAMTSTPALAAAMEAVGNSTPSVGYGLAYPLGVLGVIFMVQLLPLVLKISLEEEQKKYKSGQERVVIERKAFKVTNPNVLSISIGDISSQAENRFQIVRIQRADKVFSPHPDDFLLMGDLVLAVGAPKGWNELKILFGEPVDVVIPQSLEAKSRWLTVTSKKFVGKDLGNLEITPMYGVIITRIRRGEAEFSPSSNFVIEAGDDIRVSGNPTDLQRFAGVVGRDRDSLHETDIFSFAFGLALGVLVGMIKLPLTKSLSISLGIAGGPLIVGILFGYFGRFGRLSGRMPKAANNIVGELGLYLFLAVAGSLAGEHFVHILKTQGLSLILSGFLITLAPMLIAVFVARYILKINFLVILGMICGGMTSTPALGVIQSNTKSDIPALSYTGIYPLAVLFTTLMAQILVLF